MIQELVEIPHRYPYGVVVDTRVPCFDKPGGSWLKAIYGNSFILGDMLSAFKTIEYYDSMAIERVFISTHEMDLQTFRDPLGDPVELFMPHTKAYYEQVDENGNRKRLCDTFRSLPSISALLTHLGVCTIKDQQATAEVVIRNLAELSGNPAGWRNTIPGKFDISSDGLITMDDAKNIARANGAPYNEDSWVSMLIHQNEWFRDPILRLNERCPVVKSTTLMKYVSPSYYAPGCRSKYMTESDNELPCPVEELRFNWSQECTAEVMSVMQAISILPYSDIKLTVLNQSPWSHCEYAIHRMLPGFIDNTYTTKPLRKALRRLLHRCGDSVIGIELRMCWNEDLFLTFQLSNGGSQTLYINTVIVGGLGTHALISGPNK